MTAAPLEALPAAAQAVGAQSQGPAVKGGRGATVMVHFKQLPQRHAGHEGAGPTTNNGMAKNGQRVNNNRYGAAMPRCVAWERRRRGREAGIASPPGHAKQRKHSHPQRYGTRARAPPLPGARGAEGGRKTTYIVVGGVLACHGASCLRRCQWRPCCWRQCSAWHRWCRQPRCRWGSSSLRREADQGGEKATARCARRRVLGI